MCGIIGYVGHRASQNVLMEGLKRLEYRGYDSAGVAWRNNGRIECVREVGNLDALGAALVAHEKWNDGPEPATVTAGIGHTRWATHGAVTRSNAHPHSDSTGRVRVVLNGIIENYLELRERLARHSIVYRSETDAEVVAHLISLHYNGDLVEALQRSLQELEGHYAIVAMCVEHPEMLVGVRKDCPLVVGLGEGEQFVASSASAFLAHTRRIALLGDGEVAVLQADGVSVVDPVGTAHQPLPIDVEWDEERCEKDGFETFMLKEIHEQGAAISETLSQWRSSGPCLVARNLDPCRIRRLVIVGCGTSFHAGIAGRMAIERWARIPVEVDVASEFRYRDPIVGPDTLVLGITQSGETADTLAAMRLARAQGATVLTITNVPGSQATREADAVLFTRAGIEMGVAATKTFVSQVALLYALALQLAENARTLDSDELTQFRSELDLLPERVDMVVRTVNDRVQELAEQLVSSPFFLYLGRLSGVPVALEGALKLKEISYVPTDAYAAGEMKHGPIALLSEDTPVICVATEARVLPKLLSNLAEVKARGARVLAVAPEGCKEIAEHAEHVVYVPRTDPLLQVVVSVVPLQLFAYHLARARALNVDQPRNLAKTVTVE